MNITSSGGLATDSSYSATAPAAVSSLTATGLTRVGGGTTAANDAGKTQAADQGDAVDSKALDAAIKSANDAAQRSGSSVEFARDDDSGRIVVRVVDSETQKVLRQMPSKEMIELAKSLDTMRGTMINAKA